MSFKSLIPFGRFSLAGSGEDVDPFLALRREMDKVWDDVATGWALPATFAENKWLNPKVNVAETEKGLEVSAELPGLKPEEIHVELADGVLTLKAERKSEKEEKNEEKKYHLVERSQGTYLRRFAMPFEPQQDKVEAHLKDGVLKIFVPKAEGAKPKGQRIAVAAS